MFFARLLQDTIEPVVKTNMRKTWPDKDVKDWVHDLSIPEKIAIRGANLNDIIQKIYDWNKQNKICWKAHFLDDS